MKCVLTLSVQLSVAVGAMAGENLVPNPSAEKVAKDGKPEGWGLYVGAGGMKLTATDQEQHSGQRAARLEVSQWYLPKGALGRAG